MSSQKLKLISDYLLYLPIAWLAVGIIWFPQGSKPMVAVVSVVFILQLFISGILHIQYNLKHCRWLWGVLASSVFVSVSYVIHGASSQEVRGLLLALVYLSVLPKGFITEKKLELFVFVSAIAACSLSIWYYFIVPTDRMLWPTNPIPLAAHQGLIALMSLGLLLTRYNNKNACILLMSLLLSGFSILPTESRGVILGVVGLILLVLLWLVVQKKIRTRIFSLALVVIFCVLAMAKDALVSRVSDTVAEVTRIQKGDMNSSIGLRLQMYQAGMDLIFQKPILGHGEITSSYAQEHAPGYTNTAYGLMKGHFHNNYIDKTVKSGLVGLAFMMFLLFYPIYKSVIVYKEHFWIFFLIPAHYLIFSLTDSPFRNGDTTVLYIVVIGLIFNCLESPNKEPQNETTLLR